MSRKRLGALAALAMAAGTAIPAAALGGAKAASTHAKAASTHTVILKNIRFHPATLNIKRGESVKWLWEDETEHNVTFHGFHSRTQERGSYTVRFTRRGTFDYHCTIHFRQGMKGEIIVH